MTETFDIQLFLWGYLVGQVLAGAVMLVTFLWVDRYAVNHGWW